MPRGLFLALDGIDGTGKSTQCRLLVDWLRSLALPVLPCADPGGTALGDRLRALLLDARHDIGLRAEALLFMASRAELVDRLIRPALQAGQIVVSDRFLLANIVYQGHAGGLDVAELWTVGMLATGGILPDRTFVLDVPLELALQRRKAMADRLEGRPTDYHARVREGFRLEAQRDPLRRRLLDASGSIDAVQQSLRTEVLPLLHEFGHLLPGKERR